MSVAMTEYNGDRPTKPMDRFRKAVFTAERVEDLRQSLPAHIPFERFEKNFLSAVMQNPELLNCKPAEVYREVMKSAQLGLSLDPQLGEAYIVLMWRRDQPKEPQLRTGYKGLMKLARQSGVVTNIYAHEVCENDTVEIELGLDKRLRHKPELKDDPGEPYMYYAVVKFREGEGEPDFECMGLRQIERIRDATDGWKAYKAGRIKSTPWATAFDEMAKKTVLRRLLKRVPQSAELSEILKAEDQAEFGRLPQITSGEPAERAPAESTAGSNGGQIAYHPAAEAGSEEPVDAEYSEAPAEPDPFAVVDAQGEVIEVESADEALAKLVELFGQAKTRKAVQTLQENMSDLMQRLRSLEIDVAPVSDAVRDAKARTEPKQEKAEAKAAPPRRDAAVLAKEDQAEYAGKNPVAQTPAPSDTAASPGDLF